MPRTVMSALASLVVLTLLASPLLSRDPDAGLKVGSPDLKSAGPLAFGPEGILFVADPLGAAVFAFDTEDRSPGPVAAVKVERIDEKVAGLLGTSAREIAINDLAVNPASGKAYLSVSRGLGPDAAPVIIRVSEKMELQALPLEKLKYAKAALVDAPAGQAKAKQNPRTESITDLAFVDGQILIAGLSNEEFASTLRSIAYPFKDVAKGTSVEIYHGAHGKLETRAPVRTFAPFRIGGAQHLFAAYTCTPLVTFPIAKLQPGTHLKGRTVAELGNGNKPLDMVVYKKDGKDYLLIANSRRGVMKVSTENVEKADSISEQVKDGGTKGLPYETVASWKGIEQLDRLDDTRALVVRRAETGSLELETLPLP